VLLYGPPGTGKTTFAVSLAAELGVSAWAVAPKSSRDAGESRRMSLVAAAARAAVSPGAIVVVDEAENVLTDRYQAVSRGESVDKGWINGFMEMPGKRVVWIVNYPNMIDQTVRRRFGFSLNFPPLGKKERRKLWDGILRRHGMDGGALGGSLEGLVQDHRVPAAVIESAVGQAAALGGDDPAGDITLAVEAYETLRDGGARPPVKSGAAKEFAVEAVASDTDIPGLVGRLKSIDAARGKGPLPPGFGTMLFFGPPGTGKTALARHLAEALDKELVVRRASDILDPYVGMTERNMAQAFREAEREDSFLLIDEADSFVYSRGMAVRSWEATSVNEFLTCLEECRCFMAATSNRRESMDSAAMRRFSFKVPFRYSGPRELEVLYLKLLAPLTGTEPSAGFIKRLSSEESLSPGDFHAVRTRNLACGVREAGHEALWKELFLAWDLKLEKGARRIGF
jgi:SpoVK/Ycf46/Vps4 family AAA+-type ATPase